MSEHPFQQFLSEFIPVVARKSKDLNLASWILETTGSEDAAVLKADLDAELRILFSDSATYRKLAGWEKEGGLKDPIAKRELNVLVRAFKQNQLPQELLQKIALKEAELAQSYANFRPLIGGKPATENEIREILKSEEDPAKRKEAWEASKKIGPVLAPQILELVDLRNKAAHSLGYSDYFQMQLDLQEVDSKWLVATLENLGKQSDAAYAKALGKIDSKLSKRFRTPQEKLGPWAWSDPFCQEDPLDASALDQLVANTDIAKASDLFYKRMGIDVGPVLARSDLYEKKGKNQHAFCMDVDRKDDIRILENIVPNIKWLETTLHELGHAIYDLGYDPNLPWLLREPPHMITTEAMALLAGRQAYRYDSLKALVSAPKSAESLLQEADEGLQRRQLIFSRWVLVMTVFERELYRDPKQDLNRLWWSLVEKYQKIRAPENRKGQMDWACKYHIGLAPVYYFSYLLGEMFASSMQESIFQQTGKRGIDFPEAGKFLHDKLFWPGDRMPWYDLVRHVTGSPLNGDAWLREFAPK